MFNQLKKYFYLYKKDIFYNILFFCLFFLILAVLVKFCLIDTGVINIIDSTKINIPVESDLNGKKIIEDQKKIIENIKTTKTNVPLHKDPTFILIAIFAGSVIIYFAVTVISEAVKGLLE